MKKRIVCFMALVVLAIVSINCKSVSKAKMADGKTAVTAHKWGYVFFTAGGAPQVDCIEMLAKEGIKASELRDTYGGPEGAGIMSNRTSTSIDACSAWAVKE